MSDPLLRWPVLSRDQRIRAAVLAAVKRDWAFSIEIIGLRGILEALTRPEASFACRQLVERVQVEFNSMEENQCRKA